MGTMTKADLIAAAAEKAGLAKADAGRALNALVATIQDSTAAGDTVRIAGFGHFRTRIRKARLGRNPQTGAEVQIPESTVLAFKPARPKVDAA